MMPLAEWDHKIGHHLRMIEAGADMIEQHVEQLWYQPDFETRCEDEMARAEKSLARAYDRVRRARAAFVSKPHDD